MPQTLTGKITASGAPPVFKDAVIDTNPEGWAALPLNEKNQVAEDFYKRHYESNADFKSLPESDRKEIKVDFIRRNVFGMDQAPVKSQIYGNDAVSQLAGVASHPLEAAQDALNGFGAGELTTANYITQPGEKALNTGVGRYDATKTPLYEYNPVFRAGADVGRFGGQAAQWAINPLVGIAGSANENAQRVANKEQNPGQAVFNTALDALIGKFGPQSKSLVGAILKNAGVGAAGGAAGDVGNSVLTGQKVDIGHVLQAAKEGAITGGAIGGGTHLAHGGSIFAPKEAPANPLLVARGQRTGIEPAQAREAARILHPDNQQITQLRQATRNRAATIKATESVGERQTLQAKITQMRRLYEDLSMLANHAQTPDHIKAEANHQRAQVKAIHDHLQNVLEQQKQAAKPVKAEKRQVNDPQEQENLVRLTHELRKRGDVKQADQLLSQFHSETKARVYDEVKRREAIDKARLNQAQKDNKALNQGEKKTQQLQSKQIKGGIKEREQEKRQAEQPKGQQPTQGPKEKQQPKAPQGQAVKVQSATDMQATLTKAEKQGLEVRIRYKAEGGQGRVNEEGKVDQAPERVETTKARISELEGRLDAARRSGRGTKTLEVQLQQANNSLATREGIIERGPEQVGGESLNKGHNAPRIESVVQAPHSTKSGHIVYRTIDEAGNLKTRHIDHPESGSKTISVELTGNKAKHALVDGKPVEVGTGNQVEASPTSEAAYTSDVESALDLIKRIERGETPTSGEILRAANQLKDSDLTDVYDKMDTEQQQEHHKEKTGEDC